MFKFSKKGIIRDQVTTLCGKTITKTWLWPWSRTSGLAYSIDVSSHKGLQLKSYHIDDSHMSFNDVVSREERAYAPALVKEEYGLPLYKIDLSVILAGYLQQFLTAGEYLVFIPLSPSIGKEFWSNKGFGWQGSTDGYIMNLSDYKGSFYDLARKSKEQYPGRYMYVAVNSAGMRLESYD